MDADVFKGKDGDNSNPPEAKTNVRGGNTGKKDVANPNTSSRKNPNEANPRRNVNTKPPGNDVSPVSDDPFDAVDPSVFNKDAPDSERAQGRFSQSDRRNMKEQPQSHARPDPRPDNDGNSSEDPFDAVDPGTMFKDDPSGAKGGRLPIKFVEKKTLYIPAWVNPS